MMRARRAPALVVLAGLVVAGGLLDREARPSAELRADQAVRASMPTVAPPDAVSTTWYCTGSAGDVATLVLANASDEQASGRVRVLSGQGEIGGASVVVPAKSATALQLDDIAMGGGSAVVDMEGGQVAAELLIQPAGAGGAGGTGDSEVTPCASSASTEWYFADGSTAKDASLSLSLLNPFPEDAIVDLSFSTDQGRAVPADFQGIVVPGRSVVLTNVGEHVRRRESIATEVTARSGRLVAAQHQTRTEAGKAGQSVALGAPSLGTTWHFADGFSVPGLVERFSLSNPGPSEATVLVEVALDQGSVEPLERVVPAGGQLQFVLDDAVGVPSGVAHATTIRSLDGVAVVASRTVVGSAPSTRIGRADTLGARRQAGAWVLAAGNRPGVEEWVVVANPGGDGAAVTVSALVNGNETALPGLEGVELAGGRRVSFLLSEAGAPVGAAIVVRASAPVVVELALYGVGRPGLAVSAAIPLG